MIIRPEQLAIFDSVAKARFVGEVGAYLRVNHPTAEIRLPVGRGSVASIRETNLRELIETGIRRARGHNLQFASNQMAFVVLMFLVAPNFDEHPLVANILRTHRNIADFRFHRVWEDLSDADWEDAKRGYNTAAWG